MTRFPFRPSFPFILMVMVMAVAVWKALEIVRDGPDVIPAMRGLDNVTGCVRTAISTKTIARNAQKC